MKHLTDTELYKLLNKLGNEIDDVTKPYNERNHLYQLEQRVMDELDNRGQRY